MKILFDQGTPVPLRRFLDGHEVHTVFEKGWDRLSNGDVLAVATDQPQHRGSGHGRCARTSRRSYRSEIRRRVDRFGTKIPQRPEVTRA
jgi:hypothetical protein